MIFSQNHFAGHIELNETKIKQSPVQEAINGVGEVSYKYIGTEQKEFEGQVAIVTGAASGIGLAIARRLLNEGARVALLDTNKAVLEDSFKNHTANSRTFVIDICRPISVETTIRDIIEDYGKIDILVNCAGITKTGNILSPEVNFMSNFYISKAVIPHMLHRKYGRILHIASIAGKEGNAGTPAYSSTKAAIIGMTKVQGKEYADTGITINAFAHAVIRTPLVDTLPEIQVKYMTDGMRMKRCGTLEEAAELVAYIVSRKNSFVTGFTFDLTGIHP